MIVAINNLQSGSVQTLEGTVSRIDREGEDFVLRDATGQIWVEVDLDDDIALRLSLGQRVTVIGRLDEPDDLNDFDFDALRVTRADGLVVFDRLGSRAAGRGDDVLTGNSRADTLKGGTGNDILTGRGGRDTLMGGSGRDTLIGGLGKDVLLGGAGRDRFVYESVAEAGDQINDFNAAVDVIDISQIFAAPQYVSLQPLTDYLQFSQVGSNTVVRIDPDGDAGVNSFRPLATLQNVAASRLSANNFIV
ncbi:MAG TPA: type I secretion C-terminal target domain-containing protein [Coleofasciculaceae cyanobacterium]|jgi:Ca2+-binding RTX toxin-like protein